MIGSLLVLLRLAKKNWIFFYLVKSALKFGYNIHIFKFWWLLCSLVL
jgi:hypothetical protein